MKYENMPCPGCGSHFHEEDDIVVCPICATPQHRSCWNENGNCVNVDKHADGYIWMPGNGIEEFQQSETKRCPICGGENPIDAYNCSNCGAFFGYQQEYNGSSIKCLYCGAENDPSNTECTNCSAPLKNISSSDRKKYFGDSGESIGEMPVDRIATYLRVSISKYLSKFRKIEEGKKVSFNWAAFLFGPFWYFFRKMYKAGIILCVVLGCVSVIFNSCLDEVNEIMTPYQEQIQTNALSQEEFETIMVKTSAVVTKPFAIGIALIILANLIGAFLADKTYLKKIKSDMQMLDEQVPDENMKTMLLSRRGGVSFLGPLCGFFIYDAIGSLLIYLADFAASHM